MRLQARVFLAAFISALSTAATATDSLGRLNVVTKLPLVSVSLLSLLKECYGANVWIPQEELSPEADGTVKDEYTEVSQVFAKPEAKVVQSEVLASEQAVPWTTLKQEWELYKKFHENKKKNDDDSVESSEDEEEEDVEELPIAFYGQQNDDDDEKDSLSKAAQEYKKTKENVGKVKQESEEESEEEADDVGSPTYSHIQGLDDLDDEEKKAVIERIFQAKENGNAPVPSSFASVEQSEEDEEESSEVQSDIESRKKGEADPELQDDGGKKKKKKKKKGKKKGGGGGWGWKKPMVIPIPAPKEEGWGWKKHDGLLEQLVKGSTWERVLAYYHQTKDHSEKEGGEGWGWEKEKKKPDLSTKLHNTGGKLVDKLFKGSFWDRAFRTYAQYKNNKKPEPPKEFSDPPLQIDW